MEIGIKDYPVPLITYKTVSLHATTTGLLYHDSDKNKWLLTARHNLYPPPPHIDRFPPPQPGYGETLIEKLVLKFKGNGTFSREWDLTQTDLLDHGRISVHQEVDIAAINLTELLEKEPRYKEYYSNKSFFTSGNLSNKYYEIGNSITILGFPSDYDFRHNTRPKAYSGKIIPMGENDLASNYRQFVFAVSVDADCLRVVSGSPVILEASNDINNVILLGTCSGYKPENKMGIISYANLINEIIGDGIELHKENWRSS